MDDDVSASPGSFGPIAPDQPAGHRGPNGRQPGPRVEQLAAGRERPGRVAGRPDRPAGRGAGAHPEDRRAGRQGHRRHPASGRLTRASWARRQAPSTCRRWPNRRSRCGVTTSDGPASSATADLPPEPVTITGDGRAVLQVLLNLVLNAEEALANQPQRQLRIGVGRENGDDPACGERHRTRRARRAAGAHLRAVLHDANR